jgi:hypothetical protein
MSMYQGMDLSRFKKIASDGKVSTLRHSRGHEIKIAHSGLSPKMREHLDGMPVHLAEGGDPAAIDPESPAEAADAPAALPPSRPDLPPKPDVMPVAGTVDVIAPARPQLASMPPPPPPNPVEELDNEAATFADDMMRGQIHPKTMSDLFAEKNTLGKIGTIFGLMVGGAGAGLTHQPNALIEMMQKELDRDLDAQKNSNANSQNWLKLSHEYQMQKAQKGQLESQTELQKAQTGMVPSQTLAYQAQARSSDADTQLKAMNTAEVATKLAAFQHLTGIVAKMPEGPTKQRGQEVLTNVIQPAITASIQAGNKKTVDKLALHNAIGGETKKAEPQDDGSGVDFKKLLDLQRKGAAMASMGMPGMSGMSPQQASQANDEAKLVQQNREIFKHWYDAWQRLDELGAGRMNPNARNAAIDLLAAQISKSALGGGAPLAEVRRTTESLFPDVTDVGSAREAKFKAAVKHFEQMEQGTPTLDMFGLKAPMPNYARTKPKATKKGTATAAPSAPTEGATGTYQGKPVIFKGGKWVPK